MADLYTFDELGMRKLADAFHAQKNEMSNLKRLLTHLSTRRHEAVYMPGKGCKLVLPQSVAYAAFGGQGDYNNVEANATAISTGNYVPLSSGSLATQNRRVVYPVTCTVIGSADDVLTEGSETIEAYNPTGLPIATNSWCIAYPHGSEWVLKELNNHGHHSVGYRITNFASDPTVDNGIGSQRFIHDNITISAHGAGDSQFTTSSFSHRDDNHIFVHHPGNYKITWGASISRVGSRDWTTTVTDSNSDTHEREVPGEVRLVLVMNYLPSFGDLATQWTDLQTDELTAYVVLPADAGEMYHTVEKTILYNHTLDTPHGQPYLRLNLAMELQSAGAGSGATAPAVTFETAWITVTAMGGAGVGGNDGTGYNAFLGTSGAFQWWGGGSAPGDFDTEGNAI